MKKIIIDTNCLLNDLNVITNIIDDGNVPVIPLMVIEELDKFKSKRNNNEELKFRARNIIKYIRKNEGKIEFVHKLRDAYEWVLKEYDLDPKYKDNKVLMLDILTEDDTILMTNDQAMYYKAKALKINAMFSVDLNMEKDYSGKITVESNSMASIRFQSNGFVLPEDLDLIESELHPNQFIKMKTFSGYDIGRYIKSEGKIKRLVHRSTEVSNIKVKNIDQQMALDALLDPKIKILTLSGRAGCLPNYTEFFTGTEWKRIDKYEKGDKVLQWNKDTGKATLTFPKEYVVYDNKNGFYKFESKTGFMEVSEEHRIPYVSPKGKFHVANGVDDFLTGMKTKGNILRSFDFEHENKLEYSNDYLRLKIAVIADGYFQNKCATVIIRLKKQRKIKRLEELLIKNKIEYKVKRNYRSFDIFSFVMDNKEKDFTDKKWMAMNRKQREIFMEEILEWDGSKGIGNRYGSFSTTVKGSAELVQFIGHATGFRVSIREDIRKDKYKNGVCYDLNISRNTNMTFDNHPIKTKSEDGKKYCFTVDETFFVVRQKGNIFITGNTGKTLIALAYALEEIKSSRYNKILLGKNITPIDKWSYTGFTKGETTDKLLSHFGNYTSNLEFLATCNYRNMNEVMDGKKELAKLMDDGDVEVLDIASILGRSIDKKIVIVDEAQSFDAEAMKSIITRITDGSKLIIIGDLKQETVLKLQHGNKGFQKIINQLKDCESVAHVTLKQIERGHVQQEIAEALGL